MEGPPGRWVILAIEINWLVTVQQAVNYLHTFLKPIEPFTLREQIKAVVIVLTLLPAGS